MNESANNKLFERILLVEDDPSHALIIKRALEDHTKEILHTETVAEGVSKLADFSPDLIITDLRLPDTTELKHVEKFVNLAGLTPVIVLTSSTLLHEAVEAMRVGAKDFIVKEFGSEFKETLNLSLLRVFSATRLEADKARLEKDMHVLRVAIENSNDGLAVVDCSGIISYYNSAFASFVSKSGGQVSALKSILGAIVKDHEELSLNLGDRFENLPINSVWHTEVTFSGDKDSAYDLSLSIFEPDSITGLDPERYAVVWVRDVSENKRREKFQREILSTTSHDLKGPLGAISLSAELVSEMTEPGSKANELVKRIISSAQGAINLIDEFLSARRIQEGTFILHPKKIDLVPMIEETIGEFEAISSTREIGLRMQTENSSVSAVVDELGLKRVLTNLISNAIKFTPKGGKIIVSARPEKEGTYLEVRDTGEGMEPSEVNKIFERFSRLEKHGAIAGSGIGLFVVKSIVNAHGGNIQVTSKVGEGTAFGIRFPSSPPVNDRGELISLDFA
ncbi:MAG: ATP-binding protein [Bdellovibrionota bacterium]